MSLQENQFFLRSLIDGQHLISTKGYPIMNRRVIQRRKLQMRTSRKLTHVLFAVFTLAIMSMAALAAEPGTPLLSSSQASDQKQGALLIYTHYGSGTTNVSENDTRINITNTHNTSSVVVHFFFVSTTCNVADFKTELTQSQTYSFLTSDFDPDQQGYIMAIAEDEDGLPIAFNYLIGDLFVKDSRITAAGPISANLGAIAFAALYDSSSVSNRLSNGFWVIPTGVSSDGVTVAITFGGHYNSLPRTLAVDNIPSLAGGDRALLILAMPANSYVTGGSAGLTSGTFGLLYDDAEQSQSFQLNPATGCQNANVLGNSYPRTAPRFETVIPAGRTGWMKIYRTGDTGFVGSVIVSNIGGRGVNFHGGHNLHVLTLAGQQTATLPVFPFELQTN